MLSTLGLLDSATRVWLSALGSLTSTICAFGVGEQQNLAAAADELERLVNGGIGGDGDYCRVEGRGSRRRSRRRSLQNPSKLDPGLLELSTRSRPFRAEFFGEFQSGFEQIGGEDVHAGELQQAGEHQANRPLPRHEHDVAAQQVQAPDGLEHGVDGFEHRAFGEGIFGRNFHDAGQDEGHDADVFGVAAARRLESGGDAGALVGCALGKGAVAAEMAIEARHVMMQGDAVADFESELASGRDRLPDRRS